MVYNDLITIICNGYDNKELIKDISNILLGNISDYSN
jgi:hypothetical protein